VQGAAALCRYCLRSLLPFGSEGAKVALVARTVEPGTSKLAGSLTEVTDWT
jgi:hypothetical protein